ncbi:unnamed protein product [Strongylus vulgaris]|uniref:Uncharacterized protein n=1 Tax=Strongylus vulgaris TaxID=40348 RepID=A0A3P7K1Z7_STRVU|nr:unnamed protein product [Strongylus vulgaris]
MDLESRKLPPQFNTNIVNEASERQRDGNNAGAYDTSRMQGTKKGCLKELDEHIAQDEVRCLDRNYYAGEDEMQRELLRAMGAGHAMSEEGVRMF